jgi:hypothetical protein
MLSRPGRKGDLARISRVRKYIRRYARMERAGTIVVVGSDLSSVVRPFRLIANEGNYQAYEKYFMPSRMTFWFELVLFAVWPIAIPLLILYVVCRVYIFRQ